MRRTVNPRGGVIARVCRANQPLPEPPAARPQQPDKTNDGSGVHRQEPQQRAGYSQPVANDGTVSQASPTLSNAPAGPVDVSVKDISGSQTLQDRRGSPIPPPPDIPPGMQKPPAFPSRQTSNVPTPKKVTGSEKVVPDKNQNQDPAVEKGVPTISGANLDSASIQKSPVTPRRNLFVPIPPPPTPPKLPKNKKSPVSSTRTGPTQTGSSGVSGRSSAVRLNNTSRVTRAATERANAMQDPVASGKKTHVRGEMTRANPGGKQTLNASLRELATDVPVMAEHVRSSPSEPIDAFAANANKRREHDSPARDEKAQSKRDHTRLNKNQPTRDKRTEAADTTKPTASGAAGNVVTNQPVMVTPSKNTSTSNPADAEMRDKNSQPVAKPQSTVAEMTRNCDVPADTNRAGDHSQPDVIPLPSHVKETMVNVPCPPDSDVPASNEKSNIEKADTISTKSQPVAELRTHKQTSKSGKGQSVVPQAAAEKSVKPSTHSMEKNSFPKSPDLLNNFYKAIGAKYYEDDDVDDEVVCLSPQVPASMHTNSRSVECGASSTSGRSSKSPLVDISDIRTPAIFGLTDVCECIPGFNVGYIRQWELLMYALNSKGNGCPAPALKTHALELSKVMHDMLTDMVNNQLQNGVSLDARSHQKFKNVREALPGLLQELDKLDPKQESIPIVMDNYGYKFPLTVSWTRTAAIDMQWLAQDAFEFLQAAVIPVSEMCYVMPTFRTNIIFGCGSYHPADVPELFNPMDLSNIQLAASVPPIKFTDGSGAHLETGDYRPCTKMLLSYFSEMAAYNYWLLPVCGQSHWSLIVVKGVSKLLEDMKRGADGQPVEIYVVNSDTLHHKDKIAVVRVALSIWLAVEISKAEHGTELVQRSRWSKFVRNNLRRAITKMTTYEVNVPGQEGLLDCGYHVLFNIKKLTTVDNKSMKENPNVVYERYSDWDRKEFNLFKTKSAGIMEYIISTKKKIVFFERYGMSSKMPHVLLAPAQWFTHMSYWGLPTKAVQLSSPKGRDLGVSGSGVPQPVAKNHKSTQKRDSESQSRVQDKDGGRSPGVTTKGKRVGPSANSKSKLVASSSMDVEELAVPIDVPVQKSSTEGDLGISTTLTPGTTRSGKVPGDIAPSDLVLETDNSQPVANFGPSELLDDGADPDYHEDAPDDDVDDRNAELDDSVVAHDYCNSRRLVKLFERNYVAAPGQANFASIVQKLRLDGFEKPNQMDRPKVVISTSNRHSTPESERQASEMLSVGDNENDFVESAGHIVHMIFAEDIDLDVPDDDVEDRTFDNNCCMLSTSGTTSRASSLSPAVPTLLPLLPLLQPLIS